MESHQEQLKQLESDIKEEWESKLNQFEQKYESQITVLTDEKTELERRSSESDSYIEALKVRVAKQETDLFESKKRIDDLMLIKSKFERLQTEAMLKKERFQSRIKELLDADPDPELIGEEVFNSLY